MKNRSLSSPPGREFRRSLLAAAVATLAASGAGAAQIDIDNPDFAIRFDNTVKLSTAYRLKDADGRLANSFDASGATTGLNFNSGDQNFSKKGFISERLDLLSEFDLVYRRNYGLRISGAGWYDAAYHRSTDAPNDPFNGQTPYNSFNRETRRVAGRDAELLDAFVFGSTEVGSAGKVNARLGQHTVLYGESLFFGDNGIAAAQGPVDVQKLLSSPNAQFKEIARPVPQLSADWQIQPSLTVGGYYQFKWRETRLPPAGSYFSSANVPWGSSSPQYVSIPGPDGLTNYVLRPGADHEPGNSGQYGAQVKWRVAETDLGFYAARYNEKAGQLYGQLDPSAPATGSTWYYVFPKDTKVYGVSASRSIGDFNVSGEASIRNNAALINGQVLTFGPTGVAAPPFATGRTAHVNISALASFGENFLAKESAFVGELAWNRLLHKDDPAGTLDAGRTRDASAVQFIYTPTYRQVVPGLDLNVPIGVRYNIDGRSSVAAWGPHGTGQANIGIDANYLSVWQISLNYTHFIGKSVPLVDYSTFTFTSGNVYADRDYLSFNVRRTF